MFLAVVFLAEVTNVIVLNRELPRELVQLVESGDWVDGAWQRDFVTRTQSKYLSDVAFIQPSAMGAWLDELYEFRTTQGAAMLRDLFAADASTLTGAPVAMPLIDLALGLPLVAIAGEPWLWLDYRVGGEPAVLELEISQGWKQLARSFGELLSGRGAAPSP